MHHRCRARSTRARRAKAPNRWSRSVPLALLVTLGCGNDAPPAPPVTTPIDDLLECDITELDCQESIYGSVAEWLGSDPNDPPGIRTITVEQYEIELQNSITPDDYLDVDSLTRGFQLMGLVDEGVSSLIDAQVDNLVASVAAYFDPADGMITVIDRDYPDIEAQALLAHEFVHAIQDREFGFDIIQGNVETEDAFIGTRSVIEGDAEHNSIAWTFDRLGMPLTADEWNAIHDETKSLLRNSANDDGLSVIDLASTFPYVYGREFMSDAILDAGLGVRAVLWRDGPGGSLDVMSGYPAFREATGPTRDVPFDAYPSVPTDYAETDRNELGSWNVFAFLHRHGIGSDLAWGAAMAATGDIFAVYESNTDTVAVWRIRFAPTEFDVANIVATAMPSGMLPRFWGTGQSGDDVFIIATESAAVLDTWQAEPMESVPSQAVPKGAAPPLGGPISKGTCVARRGDPLSLSRLRSHLAASPPQ